MGRSSFLKQRTNEDDDLTRLFFFSLILPPCWRKFRETYFVDADTRRGMPRDRLRRVENYLHKLFDSAAWHRHLSILLSNLARERVVSLPRGARCSGNATTGAESFGWCERERGKKDRVRAESNRSWAIPKRNSRESHSDLRHRDRLSTSRFDCSSKFLDS